MNDTVAVDGLRTLPTHHGVTDDGQSWVAYNEPEYLQARHGFPAALLTNIAALGALARAAAAQDP
jgi:hypothetical protein